MFKVTVRTSASNVLPRWLNVQGTIIHCSTQDDWMLRIKSYSIATKIIQDAWIFTTRFSWVASGSSKNLIWLFLLSFSFLFCSCFCYCYCCFVLVFFFVLVFGILVVVVACCCCCCCCFWDYCSWFCSCGCGFCFCSGSGSLRTRTCSVSSNTLGTTQTQFFTA